MTFCNKKYFHCIANIFSSLSGSSPPLPFEKPPFPFYWPVMLPSWDPFLLTVLIFPTGRHKTETKKSKAFLEAKRHWEKKMAMLLVYLCISKIWTGSCCPACSITIKKKLISTTKDWGQHSATCLYLVYTVGSLEESAHSVSTRKRSAASGLH